MSDYAGKAASAERMLQKAGTPVTLSRTTEGAFNPDTGTCATATTTTCTGYGVLKNYSQYTVDNTQIQAGDMELLLNASTLSFSPAANDKCIVGSATWTAVSVVTVQPGAVPVLYNVQVRR